MVAAAAVASAIQSILPIKNSLDSRLSGLDEECKTSQDQQELRCESETRDTSSYSIDRVGNQSLDQLSSTSKSSERLLGEDSRYMHNLYQRLHNITQTDTVSIPLCQLIKAYKISCHYILISYMYCIYKDI